MSPTDPLSLQEIDDFLVSQDHRLCAWCNGNQWGLHIETGNENISIASPTPSLRALPAINLEKGADGNLKGTVSIGPESSLIMAAAECKACGHLDFFNYFTILKMARAADSKKEKNGDTSSN